MKELISWNANYLLTSEREDAYSLRFKFEQEFDERKYIVIGGGIDELEYISELFKGPIKDFLKIFYIEVFL